VLGFPETGSWGENLIYSVLDNFWPAINFGDLEVDVGGVLITKKTLAELLGQFSVKEDFTAHLYYQAFTNPTIQPIKNGLPILGECIVYLLAGSEVMPKTVAMTRKSGMQIYEKQFRSIVPFCGVFVCRDDRGNAALREMEPPGHDKWDPDLPEKGANRKAHGELLAFIRDCIKRLSPADDTKAIPVPGLSKYLPDDEETPEEAFDDQNTEQKNKESFNRQIAPGKIEGRKIEQRKQMRPDESRPDELDGAEGDTGGGTGGGDEDHGGNSPGGADGGGGSSTGGAASKPAIPIRYRTFASDASAGIYRVNIVPESVPDSGRLNMLIWAVGDDRKVPAGVKSARLLDGTSIPVGQSGLVVGPVKVSASGSLKLEVVLVEPLRVAMEVGAHEA